MLVFLAKMNFPLIRYMRSILCALENFSNKEVELNHDLKSAGISPDV